MCPQAGCSTCTAPPGRLFPAGAPQCGPCPSCLICKKAGLGSDSSRSFISLFSPNKGTFSLLVLSKIPSEGISWRKSPFPGGEGMQSTSVGKASGQALLSPLFVLGSLIKGEFSWWWWLFVTRGSRGMCSSPKPQPCPAAGVPQGWLPCHGGVGSVYIQGYYPCGCLLGCLGIRGRRGAEWLSQSWEGAGSHCPSWDGVFAPHTGMP